MKRKETSVVIHGFGRHKTAGWQGVIYTNHGGEQRIANGIYSWPLTEKRRDAVHDIPVEDVPLSSMVKVMEDTCEKNPFSGPPQDLVQALQVMAKEQGSGEE